jgi:hypothetical protein
MKLSPELQLVAQQLSRAAGFPKPRAAPARVNWNRWLDVIDEHQLGPFLVSRARSAQLPRRAEQEIRDRYVRSGHDAAFWAPELARIVELIGGASEPILLKGAALVHTLYADAAERQMSDFDLLFASKDDLHRAERILHSEGFRATAERGITLATHHHVAPLAQTIADVRVELHLDLATPPLPKRTLQWMVSRRQRVLAHGHSLFVLDPISRLMHHALHATADPIDSPLLRNLFEVAWMVFRLDPADRSALRSLAKRWGIEDRLATALVLAADIFGAPPILTRPAIGARELWCRARLEWSDTFAQETSEWRRFTKSLAHAHMKELKRGHEIARGLPALLWVFAKAVMNGAASRIGAWVIPRSKLEPVTLEMATIGRRLLAHDPHTGFVHLLDEVSTRVLSAMKKGARLEAIGIRRRAVKAAIKRLLDAHLVRERTKKRSRP